MQKFRVELIKYEVKSVKPTEIEIPANDTFLESNRRYPLGNYSCRR